MKPVTPRQAAAIMFGIVLGLGLGIGGYTFLYAKGWSYLTNDPAACANCHVMREHYDAWIKSSHRAVATCNDCHTPHNFSGNIMSRRITASGTPMRSPQETFTSQFK